MAQADSGWWSRRCFLEAHLAWGYDIRMSKRLVIYLLVTFGLTWGVLIPAGMMLGTFEAGIDSSIPMFALVALSMFFPLVGALVAHAACKREGSFDLCLRPRLEGNLKWYLLAWFGPAGITALSGFVYFAVFSQQFDPSMSTYLTSLQTQSDAQGTELPLPPALLFGAILLTAVTVAPFFNMLFGFGEEVGWRGLLFPELTLHMPQRTAAVVSGVIWGIWHAPIIAMGHNYGMAYAGFPLLGIATMILACTAFGVVLAYLRVQTHSVWSCALAHGAFNAVANIGVAFSTIGPTVFGPTPLGLVAGIPLIILGIVCWKKL